MALALQLRRCDSVVVVACQGRIVFGEETTALCKTVRDLLPGNPQIVLNLQCVENIDSGGIGALMGLVSSARRAGGDVKLCQVSRKVSQVLDITRLYAVVEIFLTEAAAVAAFRPRAAVA